MNNNEMNNNEMNNNEMNNNDMNNNDMNNNDMKKKLSTIFFVVIVSCFILLWLVCYYRSTTERNYFFSEDDFSVKQDGLWFEYETTPVNTTQDGKKEYEYNFTLHNDGIYTFQNWGMNVSFEKPFSVEEAWNMEYVMGQDKIELIANSENEVITTGNTATLGMRVISENPPRAMLIKLHGLKKYNPHNTTAFWLFVFALFIWFIYMLANGLTHMSTMKYLLKQKLDSQIIHGMASMYSTTITVNLTDGKMQIFRSTGKGKKYVASIGDHLDYEYGFKTYMKKIYKDDIEKFDDINTLEKMREMLKQGDFEIKYRSNYDGTIGYYEVRFILLEEGQDCVIAFRNVDKETEKEMKYNELLRSAVVEAREASEAKSAFFARMSHEIRTPMNAILGMSEILSKSELNSEQRDYVSTIQNSGKVLLEIINDILDFSKIETGKIDFQDNMYDPKHQFAELQKIYDVRVDSDKVKINVNMDDRLPDLLIGDDTRISQIVINLINNALQMTPEGTITLEVQPEAIGEEKALISYSIADTGKGMVNAEVDRLNAFFEDKKEKKRLVYDDISLGISIVKQLVDLLGGTVHVDSMVGIGSKFSFAIEQKLANKHTKHEKEIPEGDFTASKARILIVDDYPVNLQVACGLLAPMQMQIDTAESGPKAIEMVQKNHYDLVFMDHMMPDMDGVDTLHIIRKLGEEYEKLPVVALTANAMNESKAQLMAEGMDDYLSKPIDLKEMNRVLRKWLPAECIDAEKPKVEKEKPAAEKNSEVKKLELLKGLVSEIDFEAGRKFCGSTEQLTELLKDYYKLIPTKAEKIRKHLESEEWDKYRVEVHGLKSTSMIVGATELSGRFKQLEEYALEGKKEQILENTEAVLKQYEGYREHLKNLMNSKSKKMPAMEPEMLKDLLQHLKVAADEFDLDEIDTQMKKTEYYQLPPEYVEKFEKLQVYVADVNFDSIQELVDKMIEEGE